MNASKKWTVCAVIAVLGTVTVAMFVWPQSHALDEWKAAQRARGESFSLAELTPPFSFECRKLEIAVSNMIDRLIVTPLAPGTLSLMQTNGTGRARRLISAWEGPAGPGRGPSWAEVIAQMTSNAPILREIGALLENPPPGSAANFARDGWDAGTFSLVRKRRLAQMLGAAVVVEAQRGQIAEALARLHTLFRLAHWHEEEATLVGHMINIAIAGLASSAAWEALQAPGWDEARLAALQRDLEQATTLPHLPRTLRRERAIIVSLSDYARTNSGGMKVLSGGSGTSGGFGDFFRDHVYTPVWQKALSRDDELRLLESLEFILSAIQAGVSNRAFAGMKPGFDAHHRGRRHHILNQWRYPLSEAGEANWEKACFSLMRHETQLQLARAATAIERYRLRQGNEPSSLHALVPEFTTDLPWDFLIGAPLHYRRNSGGRYSLWAVGKNLRDDNATGDDLIWPEPVHEPSH